MSGIGGLADRDDSVSRVMSWLAAAAEPDGRLPPERRVAAELGLTRTEVRKAYAALERDGRVVRQVGRGTFLRAERFGRDDLQDVKLRTGPREAMQARLLIEPELAALAAINASVQQISQLRNLAQETRAVASWADYETLDARFHRLIAEAAGNTLLLAVHDVVNEVRRAVIWTWLDTRPAGPPPDYTSFAEHEAILDAIARRDRSGAADAMRRHLRTTTSRLIGAEIA